MKKYPKIGIRPTIDGRQGGVRESLEDKTMNLAKAVAELISSNLKNGDGSPVECVIADSTIGRVAESAACAEKFEREGVGATITVTSCWCYGSETMDMHPHWPKAVWGFNGTERPGAVYLAAVLAGHAQKGLPAFGIYGHDVQDLDDNTIPADVAEKLLRFARAAMAVANMRGKSYLSFGSVCMGIAGSIVDPDFSRNIWEYVMKAWTKLRSCAVWKKESMTMKNMPRQWPGLKNIASPTKGKTLRTVPKSAKPVKRRMPTGNLL